MPRGRFRSPEGECRGQVLRVLGIGDRYTRCPRTRAVEEGKDERGIGMEGGRNKRAECIGGEIRALGGTRLEKTSGGWSGRTGRIGWT